MPFIPPGSLWREPYLLDNPGHTYSLGWQDARKTGPGFLVGRRGGLGSVKVADRFPLTEDGWSGAWAALTAIDGDAAMSLLEVLDKRAAKYSAHDAEKERRQRVYQVLAQAEKVSLFRSLGVQVVASDDQVYTIGLDSPTAKTNASRLLGSLSGSQAMVTDGAQAWSPGRAMLMPLALAALASKATADAAIVFSDGTVHATRLDGNAAVREAQLQVVRYNALAGVPAVPAGPSSAGDHAARLRTLQELRDADLISEQEYQTKRAEIIDTI